MGNEPVDAAVCGCSDAVATPVVSHGDAGGGWFLPRLFDTSDFPPRWNCGTWSAFHGWLHVLSDLLVWGAYMAIPVVLLYFARRRRDLPFPRVFVLFGAFIFACGTTHLIEAMIFWWPAYRVSGVVKLATACISWATVAALIPVVPRALALPGLKAVNARLESEVAERRRVERTLIDANAQLAQKSEEMERFVSLVSHDLKSPLVTIAGMTGMLLHDAETARHDRGRDCAKSIKTAVSRMRQSIEELLELARAGVVRLNRRPLDSGPLVEEVLGMHRGVIEERGIDVRVIGTLPRVFADEHRLVEVLDNLVANAIKHGCAGDSRRVDISGREEGGEVRLCVRDYGRGIAPRDHERVFGPFERLAEQSEGHGLGLAIVKRIVDAHGGRVWVDSTGVGGAAFWAAFPSGAAADSPTTAPRHDRT